MAIEHVRKGDPLRADDQNQLIDLANGLLDDGQTAYDSRGRHATPPPFEHFEGIYELTEAWTYPGDGTDRVPYAKGKVIEWNHTAGPLEWPRTNTPVHTIYFPRAHRYDNGDFVRLPVGRSGMRVKAVWNRQSGRWECHDPPQIQYNGSLDSSVTGSASVQVSVTIAGTTVHVTGVVDPMLGSGTLLNGTSVVIWHDEDQNKWWISNAGCP